MPRCEFDGPVEGINVVSEGDEAALVPSPDEEYIIDVSPPNPGAGNKVQMPACAL